MEKNSLKLGVETQQGEEKRNRKRGKVQRTGYISYYFTQTFSGAESPDWSIEVFSIVDVITFENQTAVSRLSALPE